MSGLAWLIPALPAIVLHEAAHAFAARAYGDHTAANAGRCSLNPFSHLQPLGTVLLVLFVLVGVFQPDHEYRQLAMLLLLAGMAAHAEPVPVDYARLGRRGACVALAGVAANLAQAVAWGIVYVATGAELACFGMALNLVVCLVNLLPVAPLDGWRALKALR